MDRERLTFPIHELGEQIGSDATRVAEKVLRENSPVVYCGADQQVSEGFAIASQMTGPDANFLPAGIALVTSSPNTEDN